MEQNKNLSLYRNKIKTYFSKPENAILVVLGILLSIFTLAPLVTILFDTFKIHVGTVETVISGKTGGYSLSNYKDLLFGNLSKRNLREPFMNTMYLSILSTIIALVYGGIVAYLITRTNMKFKKFIGAVFIFTYIMPQWTMAMVWRNLFNSNLVTGGSDGVLASLFGIRAPLWVTTGLFPSAIVLGLHYAPFAYILIGGVFKNMDANLEEAATILNTPKHKIFFRVTLPMVLPAILSTILLVFSSSMGSYPVPHYLKLSTLSTRYVEIAAQRPGSASILSVIMILIGITILTVNQRATSSRKSYTTVTGKSGQVTKVRLGKISMYTIPSVLIVLTLFTSIYPIIAFAVETFLQNPGDYSQFTLKWWITKTGGGEQGMYGQAGMLYNREIWGGFIGSIRVALFSAFFAGTIGLLVGYAVSKKRRSKYAGYVNAISFLPYLLPSLSVGAAYFVFGNMIGLWGTYTILIIVGTIKYVPFASRSSLSAMMQLSSEIEEAAYIQNIPWYKRMFRIVIPIQKTAILSGYLLPFMTALRELTLFMLLVPQAMIVTTLLDYYDEMGLYAFSSGINLILIVFILIINKVIETLTGASLDKGIGG
ncbi:ABC transporter permease [Haploplasma modicum]|uniref:ABC transporter permease n=1 Tax=Haploplasma modicum TaxID=2150 RepID=UPI00214A9662|nr:iron ABC transporter permease [Haploplasma modicum]MCR1808742.1 iron ABC transporter permease [Haploplasma modicum]